MEVTPMELRFPLILDGATGTELQKRGYTGDVCAEQWTLDHPDAIIDIQRGYVAAGSQVVYTPTFGANRRKLEESGLFNCTADYNRRLAELSAQAVQGKALRAGDMSPTGRVPRPAGRRVLRGAGGHLHRAGRRSGTRRRGPVRHRDHDDPLRRPVRRCWPSAASATNLSFVTFTCDENGRSISGTDITAALVVLQGMGIDAFGLNCSAGPEQMLLQLKRLREYARVPLIAKPNAGMPIIENGETVYRCTGEEFTALVPEFLAAGVAVFGGCCGTTAAHIAALARALDGAVITPPAPQHTNELPAATEKLPFPLPVDVSWHTVIDLTGDAEETLTAALDSGETVLALRIASWDVYRPWRTTSMCSPSRCASICDDHPAAGGRPPGLSGPRPVRRRPARRTRSCPCVPNTVSCCKKTRPLRALFFIPFSRYSRRSSRRSRSSRRIRRFSAPAAHYAGPAHRTAPPVPAAPSPSSS